MASSRAPVQKPRSHGPLLLYWGGIVDSTNDAGYDGGASQLLKIPSSISYAALLSKIRIVTGYLHDEYKLKLICRWPTDKFNFAFVNIVDDESARLMLGLFDRIFTIELFVEADRVLRDPTSNLIGGHVSHTDASTSSLNFMPQPTQTLSNQHSYQQMHPNSAQAQVQHASHGHVCNPPQQGKNSREHNKPTTASSIEELLKEGDDTSDDDESMDYFEEPPLVIARPGKSMWLNRIFPSKEVMLQELLRWSLARHVQYTSDCSYAYIYASYCVHGNCKWSLWASQKLDIKAHPFWYISSYSEEHSCTNPVRFKNHQECSSSFICDYIMPVFKANFIMSVREIMELVKSEFCIDIPYSKAYYARKKALKYVDGDEPRIPPSRQNLPCSQPCNVKKRTDRKNEELSGDKFSCNGRKRRARAADI